MTRILNGRPYGIWTFRVVDLLSECFHVFVQVIIMMSSVSKRHRMAALAGHTLQRTLLARWRHAAIAPIYSAAGRQVGFLSCN